MRDTRTGKIAELPCALRDELNRPLDDNVMGQRLLVWLNALPEVRALLAARFGGRLVSAQNLSHWKRGGYRDWVVSSEVREWDVVQKSSD